MRFFIHGELMEQIEKFLCEQTFALCQIPSQTGNEREIATYLEKSALQETKGLEVQRHGNALIVHLGPKSGKQVALLGHLDTVPSAKEQLMELNWQQRRIYGTGASDMKGGVAVMLGLLREFADSAVVSLPIGIYFVFYDREEGPISENGLEPLLAQGLLKNIYFAICLEPTDGEIHSGCVGSIQAKVEFFGKRAHSARPWQGKNALYQAIPFLQRIEKFGNREVTVGGLSFYEVMNVTLMKGGVARNVIPDQVEFNVNYRFSPQKNFEQAISEIEQIVFGEGIVSVLEKAPAGAVLHDHKAVSSWIQKNQIRVAAKQAWTDVGRLTLYDIPSINFGPGETAQAHQSNEFILIDRLVHSYQLLKDWIIHF